MVRIQYTRPYTSVLKRYVGEIVRCAGGEDMVELPGVELSLYLVATLLCEFAVTSPRLRF